MATSNETALSYAGLECEEWRGFYDSESKQLDKRAWKTAERRLSVSLTHREGKILRTIS
jgi:hypothetical protein